MSAGQNKDAVHDPKQVKEMIRYLRSPEIKDDVFKWVMAAYPWGQPNTSLADFPFPRKWQIEEMNRISEHIAANKVKVFRGETPDIYKFAMASGRGPGKSAFVAMIVNWFMTCVWGGTCIISANTDAQLTTYTFGEIRKWKNLSQSGFWFDMNQKELFPQPWFAKLLAENNIPTEHYQAKGTLWNEDATDSFAGAHNPKGMMIIFDEASGIPQPIWDVTEGFLTDVSIYRFWFAFSNPRSNTGAFFDRFHDPKLSVGWVTRKLDSRHAGGANIDIKHLQGIVDRYGEDSDTARVEVRGEFPSTGDKQFISRGLVADAVKRRLDGNPHDSVIERHAPLVIGCDPARFGSDSTVILFRQGRDCHSIPAIELKKCDNMVVANKLAALADQHDPDAIIIDAGAGAGIIDRLREMNYKVFESNFGGASEDPQYADHRTEMWGRMRDAMSTLSLPDHPQLTKELCLPEYEHTGREDKIKLESKDKIKKRLGVNGQSPNFADALALTFHMKIARRELRTSRQKRGRAKVTDNWKPFSDL